MPRGRRFVAALSALSMAAVLSAIDQTVVSTALPHIIASLQGAHLLGWVFTAYFLGATATVAVVGKLADLFGRRRVFIVSIALFCVGSLLCGLATSMPLLVTFRGLQGIGAGGFHGNSATLAGALLTPGIVMGPIGSVFAGLLLSRTGRYRLASLIAGVLQVTGLAMLLFSPADTGELWVTLSFVIASLGTGFGGPTFMIMYQNAIPQKQLGVGVGLLSLFRQFGASVGTALAGSIVGAGVVAGGGLTDMAPFVQRAFLLPFAASLVVIGAAWFAANRPLRTTLDEAEDLAVTTDLTRRVAALDHR